MKVICVYYQLFIIQERTWNTTREIISSQNFIGKILYQRFVKKKLKISEKGNDINLSRKTYVRVKEGLCALGWLCEGCQV